MDPNLIYTKSPTGDEAVRQSTRVVQRNLRMVLVLVDGKVSVAELAAKIGNSRLVESALRELEEGEYIAPTIDAVSVWEESKKAAKIEPRQETPLAMSQFSVFGPKSQGPGDFKNDSTLRSGFSSFGKPILPAASRAGQEVSGRTSEASPNTEPEYSPPKRPKISWRTLGLGVAGFLIISITALAVYPYERFKPSLEASLARYLQTPVKINGVGVAFFPMPQLKLTGVSIGTAAEGNIAEIRLSSPLSLLGSPPLQISRVDVSGMVLPANQFVALPVFTGEAGRSGFANIREMHFDHAKLLLGDTLSLTDIYGEIRFTADGGIEKASFETNDRSLLIEIGRAHV